MCARALGGFENCRPGGGGGMGREGPNLGVSTNTMPRLYRCLWQSCTCPNKSERKIGSTKKVRVREAAPSPCRFRMNLWHARVEDGLARLSLFLPISVLATSHNCAIGLVALGLCVREGAFARAKGARCSFLGITVIRNLDVEQ